MLTRILAICTVSGGLLLTAGAYAMDKASSNEATNEASRETMKVMNLGNPHEGQATAADKELDGKLDLRRKQRLTEWSDNYSREVYPNMGVGGHEPQAPQAGEASK